MKDTTHHYQSSVPYDWNTRKKYIDLPFTEKEYAGRIAKVEKEMEKDGIDALLVFGRMHECGDLVYLSNFIPFGKAAMVIRRGAEPAIVTDAILHGEPINSYSWMTWVKDFRPVHHDHSEFALEIADLTKEKTKVGVVGLDQIPVPLFEKIRSHAKDVVDFWLPFTQIKSIRSDAEISLLRELGRITSDGMRSAVELISEGKTEQEVVSVANKKMFEEGAHDLAFSTIVNSGPKSGVKHSYPTSRKIARGDMVYLDMGASKYGYNCDMSRTVVVGGANEEQKHVLDVILNGYETLTKMMKEGRKTSEFLSKATELENDSGLKEKYKDRIFLGLGVHHAIATSMAEFPTQGFPDTTLKKNMSFAFEPMAHILDFGTAVVEWNEIRKID